MVRITWVPGAVTHGSNITLPSGAPPIDEIVSAQIVRIPSALADHPLHSHNFLIKNNATAAKSIEASASGFEANLGADVTVAGGSTGGGVQNAAAMSHTGANPVVSATATKVNSTTITLDVDTALGDLLTLVYVPVGELVRV